MFGELNANRHFKAFQPKPNAIDELKEILQTIPQNSIKGRTEPFQETFELV